MKPPLFFVKSFKLKQENTKTLFYSVFFYHNRVFVFFVFSACASLSALQVDSSLHAYSINEGLLSSNVYVGTPFLTFYAKCGDAKSARVIFNGMQEKHILSHGVQ